MKIYYSVTIQKTQMMKEIKALVFYILIFRRKLYEVRERRPKIAGVHSKHLRNSCSFSIIFTDVCELSYGSKGTSKWWDYSLQELGAVSLQSKYTFREIKGTCFPLVNVYSVIAAFLSIWTMFIWIDFWRDPEFGWPFG